MQSILFGSVRRRHFVYVCVCVFGGFEVNEDKEEAVVVCWVLQKGFNKASQVFWRVNSLY